MTVPEVNNFDIGPNVVGTNVTWDIVAGIINANVGIAVVVVMITASTGDGEGDPSLISHPPPLDNSPKQGYQAPALLC
jgi:hypothetical protein